MKFKLTLLVAALSVGAFAQRMPTVSYTVSGSAGNWTLDFSVKSNFLNGEGNFYFFGVLLDTGRNIAGSPAGWDPNTWTSWNNSGFGGSNNNYNNNWIDLSFGATNIAPGATLGGFKAVSTAASAPTAVNWFAFAANGTYGGNDNFNSSTNPGFEGVANAVPEPATMAVLGLGVAAMIRRRKSR
jgi:hypothetical protein